MNFAWEQLGNSLFRCRLPFLDVTVGLVAGRAGVLLIDTGSTPVEAHAIRTDVRSLTGGAVSHIVLTHDHFDHVLGSSAFDDAAVYCAPTVAATITERTDHLRADALRHGADIAEVDAAIAALNRPGNEVWSEVIDLGGRAVSISHPGRGHTDHDLIVAVADADPTVVFCGDLVEESGDPCLGPDSDPSAWPTTLARVLEAGGEDAIYVPGHGAVVGAGFVRAQQAWLLGRL